MNIRETTPPPGLYERVLVRVSLARRQAARLRFAALASLSSVLTVLAVTAYQYAAAEAATSGFINYLSLAYSDSALALTSRDFLLSLVESLPSLAVLLSLVLSGLLIWSLYRTMHSARGAFMYA